MIVIKQCLVNYPLMIAYCCVCYLVYPGGYETCMLTFEVAPGWFSLIDPNLPLKYMVKEISKISKNSNSKINSMRKYLTSSCVFEPSMRQLY